jgi:hypothetical protein
MRVILLCTMLTGCAAPVITGLGAASLGVQATTGRGPTDYTLSYATNKDCQTIRLLNNDKVCQDPIVPKPIPSQSQEMERAMMERRAGL